MYSTPSLRSCSLTANSSCVRAACMRPLVAVTQSNLNNCLWQTAAHTEGHQTLQVRYMKEGQEVNAEKCMQGLVRTIVEVGPPDHHRKLHGVCADVAMHTVLARKVLGVCIHMLPNCLIHAVKYFRGCPDINKNLHKTEGSGRHLQLSFWKLRCTVPQRLALYTLTLICIWKKNCIWKGLQLHTLKVSPFFWDLVTLVSRSTESLALGQRMRLPSHLMKIVFISVISSTCTPSYFLWDVGKDLAATNATRKGQIVPPASAVWTDTARQRCSVQLAVAQAGSYRAPVLCGSEQDHIAHVERPHYEEVHHALIDGADAVPEHKDKREQQTGHSQPGTCQIHLQSRQLFLQHSLRACAPWQRTHVHKNIL